ncbi:MAG TPA: NTP transferase domain-containing protein [Thermoleophilaceae bacterium]
MVINCAGEGRRLGLGKTKALVSVLEEPLISWHLRMLRDVDDVVVVVGHQAEDVISVVSQARCDVAFAINHEYATTGTAASLALGCRGARGDVISLDGDLLVHPEDFRRLLDADGACLGVAPPNTTDAVLTTVEQRDGVRSATAFSREGEGLEWTGLLRFSGQEIEQAQARHGARGHVFEMLTPHLPIPVQDVRAREIDTPADYDRALAWVAPIAHHWA